MNRFHVHYGRWVKFPEDVSTDELLVRVRQSPLLICSILLIAVRHSTQELADAMAPELLAEAKHLVTSSLLQVQQNMEFFQAALILSLWSTTIGQVPLSIDSWLLTSYALQQGLASPAFAKVLRHGAAPPVRHHDFNTWCLWNHLCVAHLQYDHVNSDLFLLLILLRYCVGTRRSSFLRQSQIDHCLRLMGSDNVTNYEARMGAEIQLYWIIYQKCCGHQIDLADAKTSLQSWQREWAALFSKFILSQPWRGSR